MNDEDIKSEQGRGRETKNEFNFKLNEVPLCYLPSLPFLLPAQVITLTVVIIF